MLYRTGSLAFGSDLDEAFWAAIVAFSVDAIVSVGVTLVTEPRPVQELDGLVYGMAKTEETGRADRGWYRSPAILGFTVLAMTAVISLLLI